MLKRMLAAAALAIVIAATPLSARAEDLGFTIADGVKVTGMAADVSRGLYWVTDEASGVVRAISSSGKTLGTVTYQTNTQSVQALSLSRDALYIGDIGGSRTTVGLVKLNSLTYGAATAQTWQLTYPDGAHEARALLVSPKGNVYVVTAGANPGIYRAASPLSTSAANKLVRAADAPPGVTDGAFNASGDAMVLRTADQVLVVDAYKWTTTASAYVLPQASGQGLALALSTQSVLLADDAQVASATLPTTVNPNRPTPTPTAEASPSPSEQPGVEASPAPGDTSKTPSLRGTSKTPSLRGTFIALGAALALSLAGALIVVFKK